MRKFLDLNGLRIFWEKIMQKLSLKVDKENGKSLTSNDFTDTDKSKLDSLKNYTAGNNITIDTNGVISCDSAVTVDAAMSPDSENPVQNKVICAMLNGYATKNDLTGYLQLTDIDKSMSSTSENPVQNKVIWALLTGYATKNDLTGYVRFSDVDKAMSPTSENPVQNKVINTVLGGYLRVTDTAVNSDAVKQGFSQANSNYPVMMASTTDTTSISDIYGKPLRANSVTINPYSGAVNASKVTAANFIGNLTGNATNADEAVGVRQSYTGINSNFPVMLSTTTDTTSVADVMGTPYRTNAVTVNPYSGTINASKVTATTFTGDLTGNASSATTAGSSTTSDRASGVIDYTATSSTIQVGYSGSSVTAANASYVAVYTNGAHIKDMTFASLAEKLQEQSLLPITYSASAPGSSLATGTVWLQYES